MSDLPTVCLKCGSIFPSGLETDDVRRLISVGEQPVLVKESCPRCQGSGEIAHGSLQIESAIEIFLKEDNTISDFENLAHVTAGAIKSSSTREEAAGMIESQASKFAGLIRLLPYATLDLYFFLGFVMAFTQLVVAALAVKYVGHHYSIHYHFY